jgi:subtilisin family serine protease
LTGLPQKIPIPVAVVGGNLVRRELGAVLGPRRKLRNFLAAAALALVALTPPEAAAQLRGAGVPVPSVGGIGGGAIPGGVPRQDLPSTNLPGDFRLPPGSAVDPVSRPLPRDNITNTIDRAPGLPDARRTIEGAGKAVKGVPKTKTGKQVAQKASRVPPSSENRFVATEVLIGLPSNVSEQALDALATKHRLTRLQSQRIAMTGTTFHRLQIADQRTVADVIRALEADASVRIAQPNYRFALQQTKRVAVPDRAAQYSLTKLRVPEAHQLATGSRVLVAVIDGGVDTTHPEIAHAVAENFDAADSKTPPSRHGTAMAGAIAAQARLVGVAPAARILAIRSFVQTPNGYESTSFAILRGIDWAVARGARVINMSFAGPFDPEIARSLTAAAKKGVLLVAAAGNAGPQSAPLYPAAHPDVIAVTAVDSRDEISSFAVRGSHIAIAAPGVEVVGPAPGATYQLSTGTSVAAAQVSGVAALLIELRPSLKPKAIRRLLLSTARDLGAPGRDDAYGAGLVDAYRAAAAITATARAPARTSEAR